MSLPSSPSSASPAPALASRPDAPARAPAPACAAGHLTRTPAVSRRRGLLFGLAWTALAFASAPLSPAQTTGATAAPSLDAIFKQGADAYNAGNYTQAVALFETILRQAKAGPALEPVHLTIASAKLAAGNAAAAVEAYRVYLQLYPNGAQVNDGRAGLTKALIGAKRMPEALAALNSLTGLRGGTQGVDNYAALLGLTLEIADSLMDEKKPADALILLQNGLRRDQALERQRRRVNELASLYSQSVATAGALGVQSNLAANRDALGARLAEARDALAKIEGNATFDLPRLLRQGRCHLELDQPWEATVVYQDILTRFPTAPDRVFALHGLIFARQAAKRLPSAQELCQRFLVEFPTHALAPEVAALGGSIALELQDNAGATSFFGSAIEHGDAAFRERIVFQLGNARFGQRDWPGARESFERYVRDFPQGQWVDNAAYRAAITWLLAADYAQAEKAIGAFLDKYPQSTYLADARYRLAICAYAFQEYKKTLGLCDAWEKQFPNDGLLSEVLSLRGDVLKTLGTPADLTEAAETYLRAASAAATDEVLEYTLNEAARLLEQKKDWARLAEVFSTQIDRQPESKLALGWIYWVARAKARGGNPEEAWDFLAQRVGPELGNAGNNDVEKLLTLMAQIRGRMRRPAAAAAEPGAPAPAAPAPPAALAERIALPDTAEGAALARARLRFYDAKVLQLTRKPEEAKTLLLAIGREGEPAALSAALLAEAGEALLAAGDATRAEAFFSTLLARFPKAEQRDFAYVGLGDLALQKEDAATALKAFTDAIRLAGGINRLREATVGQARSLFALGRLDEAARLFEQIAGTREWRGEATALSLYHLGQIAVQQGDLPKGIAFFQRVYVSQRRYADWVVRAYLDSAKAFEQLGKTTEAIATYRELLRNDRLQNRPELESARARLGKLDTNPS